MRFMILLALLFLTSFASNSLIHSSSPYLQQHAQNPVDWIAWEENVLERAKKEHKPIFISIGYSTCHWCHVMAHESFENETIAEIINTYFIPVKIDREELSHLDSYYQQLHRQLYGRSGGWPLNAILTEEGKVFWIGTYVPPHSEEGVEGMDSMMKRFGEGYAHDKEKYRALAMNIEKISPTVVADGNISAKALFESVTSNYDALYHGFGIAPKFPEASKIALLLDLAELGNPQAKKMALEILHTMALSGLYDQSEGGFFRYSTDAGWEIPHFEKMLYNQAELIPLYVRAYQMTHNPLYADVVRETIAMTQHRFGSNGVFYSASDADSDHEEGGYFFYTEQELKQLNLSASLNAALELEDGANFEGKYHLHLATPTRPKEFRELQTRLQELRKNRHYPFIDTKIITSWNAMMIEALYKAGAIDPTYTQMGDTSLNILLKTLRVEGALYHQRVQGYPITQKALLEDYAFLISALLVGYQATLDEEKLQLAQKLCDEAITHFYTKEGWVQNSDPLKVKVDLLDKYTTSAYGRMMQNLRILSVLSEETRYERLAKKSLEQTPFLDPSLNAPSSMIAWLMGDYVLISLSHQRTILNQNRQSIAKIAYPYLYLHPEVRDDFGACTVNGCFSNDKNLDVVKKAISELKK